MSAKYLAILTNLGAAKMANATMLGTKLNVTHMAVGDGGGALPTPDQAQTALRGERRRASLNMLSVDPNNASQIIAEQVIPESEGGWWIREIGLYDSDGVLIAVANCPETYKPLLQEGSGRTQTIRMVLTVSSTEAVTLKIDPAVVLATRQYVDDKVIEVRSYIDNQLDAHERSRNHPDATLSAKGFVQLSSDDNSAAEDKAATPAAVNKVRELAETKAPLNSPSLAGTPTTPTPAMGASGLEIANAAFVSAKVAELIGSAPGVLDTLQEIAAALNNNPDFANEMMRQLAGKQPKDSTLTSISGKSVLELIEYLGLTETMRLATNAVPSIRRINSKRLSEDIALTASDIGAMPANAELPLLGVGQRYLDLSSAGMLTNVYYTNTHKSPILVIITPNNQNGVERSVVVDDVEICKIIATSDADQPYPISFVVPSGSKYKIVTTGTVRKWMVLQ
ncbi:phage tail protein [Edwardsiella tarda]|uniref:phage tail protein n=1 Tax=Edwardsiella tarda TaxID=636 RepID=UPI0024442ABB|nr:phage tail protein [Edwardsiella tarda]WGE28643.1 phage tail protein [Edwardsiella tarda]